MGWTGWKRACGREEVPHGIEWVLGWTAAAKDAQIFPPPPSCSPPCFSSLESADKWRTLPPRCTVSPSPLVSGP